MIKQPPKKLEDLPGGFCRIPNYFVDELLTVLPAPHWCVLVYLWRKTVGWNRLSDYISVSQISKGAGVSRATAVEALLWFREAGLVALDAKPGFRRVNKLCVVMDFNPEATTSLLGRLVGKAEAARFDRKVRADMRKLSKRQTSGVCQADQSLVCPADSPIDSLNRNSSIDKGYAQNSRAVCSPPDPSSSATATPTPSGLGESDSALHLVETEEVVAAPKWVPMTEEETTARIRELREGFARYLAIKNAEADAVVVQAP